MIGNNRIKISAMIVVLSLFGVSFLGVELCHTYTTALASGNKLDNSFIPFSQPGISAQENEKYGWNMSYIEDLNGDNYIDLVVGAPWYDLGLASDTGAVYIFYGSTGSSFSDLDPSAADIVITGQLDGDKFGWDVADAGDVNGDNINDLLVGAPGYMSNRGRAYIFIGGNLPTSANDADRILDGQDYGINFNGRYGSSVAGAGDLNKDGYDDVIVGAPGSDRVIITYGYKNLVTIYPNLWDDSPNPDGIVQFNNGANNTNNDISTWGLDGANDGWDWIDSFHDITRLYGQTQPAQHDHASLYGPWESDGPDADGLTFDNKSGLEVMIGRSHTGYNPYAGMTWSAAASAAWGIEFTITEAMYEYISKNSTIKLGFNYETMDANVVYNNSNLSKNYIYTLRSRIWNETGQYYMGDQIVNDEKYVFYKQDNWNVPPWGPIFGSFEWEITDYIDRPGSYYWDFGCYLGQGWSMRHDDGMIAIFDNITMEIKNKRSVAIHGADESGLGYAIASIGDINNDDYPDTLISAPYQETGVVALLHGRERFMNSASINLATIILTGDEQGDRFGYSVSPAGDVDNDGIQDIIIGAPGGNYARLYYGSTLSSIQVPDLWEHDDEKDTPQVEFNSGLKTTGNTPGLSGADDGWEVWNGVYGYEDGETPGSSVRYNNLEAVDSAQIALDNELIIAIGGLLGGGSTVGAQPDSGAYGLEFTVSQEMVSLLNSGGEAVLSYDWRFHNIGLDLDDTVWIKTSIRNDTSTLDLGWDLDKNAGNNENKDDTNEIHWADSPGDRASLFIQECSASFSQPGSYYLDFGAKVRSYWWENSAWEDGIFHFDNIHLRFNPAPAVTFIGPPNSGFGYSVSYSGKLNMDDYGDVVIGAPFYDSIQCDNIGGVFGFILEPGTDNVRQADSAEFIAYGENEGDYFGWAILGTNSLDSDEFNEIVISAINFDSSSNNVGKIYLFSISKAPKIRLLHPVGSEVLSGSVMINATVIDPDENIDTSLGIHFYYSTDTIDWILIGNDVTPSAAYTNYEQTWDTTTLSDGTSYYVKGWVQDLDLNKGENTSAAVTIDNPHPPELTIQNPGSGSVVNGIIEIKALVKDSDLDLIGGGIDLGLGVKFYFSDDKVTWEPLGTKLTGTQDFYTMALDSTSYMDGEYWIMVNATDLDGFEVEQTINIEIDNPNRSPSITLISPLNVTKLSKTVKVSASAYDFDLNINSSGVTFLVSSDASENQWQPIGNAPNPNNNNGIDIYSINWDTTTVVDHWYSLKAIVTDSEGVTNESEVSEFCVHNNADNPPVIELKIPTGGNLLDRMQLISVRVRDLEDNIDQNGVFYYYSTNKERWYFLGNTPEPRNNGYYEFYWVTDTVPDGEYWLNVSVSDTSGLTSWVTTTQPVIVHNSNLNPPVIKLLSLSKGLDINSTFMIRALAYDLENNINKNGVIFYFSDDGVDWNTISNVNEPVDEDKIFELSWDTTKYNDGIYWLRADVTDMDDQTSSAISDYLFIHNNEDNAPIITLLSPHSGVFSGTIKINVSVFDLEDNVDNDGVIFYISTDKATWSIIGKAQSGYRLDYKIIYELKWDTNTLSDNIYWLMVQVRDTTGNTEFDYSNNYIIVHNNMNNAPIIRLVAPVLNVPLGSREPIVVEVIDFESDVEGVTFYYSTDNESWKLIDSTIKPEMDNLYKIIWSTSEVTNGLYYIKAQARDMLGHSSEITAGPYEVTKGKEAKQDSQENYFDNLGSIFMIVIVIIIMALIVIAIVRRSKKREKEIIKEVASELRHSMELEQNGKADVTPQSSQEYVNGYPTEATETVQTYIPPPESSVPELPEYEPDVETIESYKAQMNAWEEEGYNISRLKQLSSTEENLFARAFPVFSANISRLKEISNKLSILNASGYDVEINSIKAKLKEPDHAATAEQEFRNLKTKLGFAPLATQVIPRARPAGELPQNQIEDLLPQLLPGSATADPVQATEVPADVELPPEIDLPLEPIESQDIPISPFVEGCHHDPDREESGLPMSPFSGVQTQTLEDELGGDVDVVELPNKSVNKSKSEK